MRALKMSRKFTALTSTPPPHEQNGEERPRECIAHLCVSPVRLRRLRSLIIIYSCGTALFSDGKKSLQRFRPVLMSS